jgi:hypothetical protein
MKRLAELTVDDLAACPVWQYHGYNDRDARVSPAPNVELTEYDIGGPVYIALTEFCLSNGSRYLGYSSPSDPSGLDYLQPVIISGRAHVRFWDQEQGTVPDDWLPLGLAKEAVFPIGWRCPVPVDGSIVQGAIPE